MAYEEKCNWFRTEPTNRVTCGRLRNVGGDSNSDFSYRNGKITIRVNWSPTLKRYDASGKVITQTAVPKRVVIWRLIGKLREYVNPNDPANAKRWVCAKIIDRDERGNIETTYVDTLPSVEDQETITTYYQILKCRRALYYKVEYIDEYMSGFTCPLFVYASGRSVIALSTCRQVIANKPYNDCEEVWSFTAPCEDDPKTNTKTKQVPFVRVVVDPLERRQTFINGGGYVSKRKVVWATRADGKIFCFDYYTGNKIADIQAKDSGGQPIFAVALNPVTGELLYTANRKLYMVSVTENGRLENKELISTDGKPAGQLLREWEGFDDKSRRYCTAATGAVCTVSPDNKRHVRFYVIYQNERVAAIPIDCSSSTSRVASKTFRDIGRTHFGCSAKTRKNQYNVYGITNAIDQAVWVNGHTPLDYCYEANKNVDGRKVQITGICKKHYVNKNYTNAQARERAQILLGLKDNDLKLARFEAANNLLASALQGKSVPMPNYALCYRDPDNDVHKYVYKESCEIQNAHPSTWESYWNIMSKNGQWGSIGCKFGLDSNVAGFDKAPDSTTLGQRNRAHVDNKKGYKFTSAKFMPKIHQTITGKKENVSDAKNAAVLQDIGFIYGCSVNDDFTSGGNNAFGCCMNYNFSNGQIESEVAENSYANDYRPDIRKACKDGTDKQGAREKAFEYFHPFTTTDKNKRNGWWGTCPKSNKLSGDKDPSDHWVYKPYLDKDGSVPQESWDVPMSQLGIGASLPENGKLTGNKIGINGSIKDSYYIYQVDYQENTLHKILIDNGKDARVGKTPLLSALASGGNELTLGSFYWSKDNNSGVSKPTHVIADDFNCVWVIGVNSIYRFYPSALSGMKYPAAVYQTEASEDSDGYLYEQGLYNNYNKNAEYFMYGQHGGNFIDSEYSIIKMWSLSPDTKPSIMSMQDARAYCLSNYVYWSGTTDYVRPFHRLNDGNKWYYAIQNNSDSGGGGGTAGWTYCHRLSVVDFKINGDDPVFGNTDSHITYNEYNSDNLGIHALVAIGEVSTFEITRPAYKYPTTTLRIVDGKHSNPNRCDNPDPECDASGEQCSAKWSSIVYEDSSGKVMDEDKSPTTTVSLAVRAYDDLSTKHALEYTDIENFDVASAVLLANGSEARETISYPTPVSVRDDATSGSYSYWLPDKIFWKYPNILGGNISLSAARISVEQRQNESGEPKTVSGQLVVGSNVYQVATKANKTTVNADNTNDIFLYERWSEPAYCINGLNPGMYGYDDVLSGMWNCEIQNG